MTTAPDSNAAATSDAQTPAALEGRAAEGPRIRIAERRTRLCDDSRLDFKAEDTDTGEVWGYASTWTVDGSRERIRKGAFSKSVRERPEVPMMVVHAARGGGGLETVGTAYHLHEDDHGLFFRARFASTTAAQDSRRLVRERHIRQASIGYRVLRSRSLRNQSDGATMELIEIALREITLTGIPTNEATEIEAKDDVPEAIVRLVREAKVRIRRQGVKRTFRRGARRG